MNNSRTLKNIRTFKTAAVPKYKLDEGSCYDVKSTGMILKEAEYAGYEVVGRLVIYRFRSSGSEYKISEPSIRRCGDIRPAGALAETKPVTEVVDQHAFQWRAGKDGGMRR